MAASARDQTARVIRPETDDPAELSPVAPSAEKESLRQPSEKSPAGRKTVDIPGIDKAKAAAAAAGEKLKANPRGKLIVGVGAVVALALIYFGLHYLFVGRYIVTTDDAYVRANNTLLGAKVPGNIAQIMVGDNKRVGAGNLIIKIDDGDYRLALESAKAKEATQEATIERIGRQATAQESAVAQAKSQITSAEAATKRTELDFARQQELSSKGFASKATYDLSLAGRDQAVASVQGAQAAYDAAVAQLDVVKAQKAEAEGTLQELRAALAKAVRDLSFTTIRAPVDGIFSNRLVNVGDYVQAGQRLGNIVPIDEVFIDANFKETQVARLKPGQRVNITVDAISGRTIPGIVDSLAPAAGSVFTLLPPDNATGNFTKIVQRLPVRIRVPMSVARENLLRAGMSVVVSVNTKGDPEGVDPVEAR